LGIVTRTSDKFISLKFNGAEKAIRLKGAFYESEFNIESYFENRARKANDAGTSSEYRIISAEHRKLAEQCRTKSEKLASKRATYNGERYQSDGRNQAEPNFSPSRESEFSPIITATDSRNSDTFEPTGRAARAVKSPISSIEQHEPRNSRNSQDQENPFTSNIVLASIALILLISSIALGYVSKSKYNDINEMQNKVDYLKSQGGSMFTMECGGNCA
jgi:hypothetical protein